MSTSSPTKKWRDAFIIELRLRGADGKQIGDELALVESHCLDADLPVEEAFGEPIAYARSVVVSRAGAARGIGARYGRWLVLRTVTQMIGLMILLNAVPAVRKGRDATFTGVDLVLVLVFTVLLAVVVAKGEAVLRFVAQGSVVKVGLTCAVITGLLVLVGLIPRVFSVSVPTLGAGLVGGVLLLLPSVVGSLPEVDEDVIIEPLVEDPPSLSRSWSSVALRWMIPAAGLVMCGVVWLVS